MPVSADEVVHETTKAVSRTSEIRGVMAEALTTLGANDIDPVAITRARADNDESGRRTR